jgi:hypothetical protein
MVYIRLGGVWGHKTCIQRLVGHVVPLLLRRFKKIERSLDYAVVINTTRRVTTQPMHLCPAR